MMIVVPDSLARRRVPPIISTRSRIPRNPLPSPLGDTQPVIMNLQPARAVLLLQAHPASPRLRVSHDVSHRFPHRQRQYTFLHRRKFHRRRGIALHREPGSFQCGFGLRQFRHQALRPISANRVAHLS